MSQRFTNDDGSLLALGALTLLAGAGAVAAARGSRGISRQGVTYTEQIRALARSGGKPDAQFVRDHAKRYGWTQAHAREGIEADVQVYLSRPTFYDGLIAQGSAATSTKEQLIARIFAMAAPLSAKEKKKHSRALMKLTLANLESIIARAVEQRAPDPLEPYYDAAYERYGDVDSVSVEGMRWPVTDVDISLMRHQGDVIADVDFRTRRRVPFSQGPGSLARAFDLDDAIARATADDYYPRSERSDVHGNPLLRAISWSAGGAAVYGDSTFESAVKHIGTALRKSGDRLRSQTDMRIFKRDGRWYTASAYSRDERYPSRTKAIEAFVRSVGPRQAQTDAVYHGVDTRPKGSRSGITLHQWVRDGRLVRLLRTDAPGFHTEYAAARRRYGLPTHSSVISGLS